MRTDGTAVARDGRMQDGGGLSRSLPTLRQEWLSRATRASVPLACTVELTRRCNLRCYHCYVHEHHTAGLAPATWIETISELAGLGCARVALSGGELMLYEGWRDVAGAVRSEGMMLSLLTNATLVSEADIDAMVALRPVRVQVSLYGGSADVHDRVTGVPDSFERSMETVRDMRRAGLPVRLSSMFMHGVGVADVVSARRLAESLECDFGCSYVVLPAENGDTGLLRHRASGDEIAAFMREGIACGLLDGHERVVREGPLHRRMANCQAGLTSLFIDALGDVYPCMGWAPPFGSTVTQTVRQVWHGERARDHRRRMLRPLSKCGTCDISGYCFTRCPKVAQIEDGAYDGPSVDACEQARALAALRDECTGVAST